MKVVSRWVKEIDSAIVDGKIYAFEMDVSYIEKFSILEPIVEEIKTLFADNDLLIK